MLGLFSFMVPSDIMNFYRSMLGDLFSGSPFHRQTDDEPSRIEYRGESRNLGAIRSIFAEGYSSLKGWMGLAGILEIILLMAAQVLIL